MKKGIKYILLSAVLSGGGISAEAQLADSLFLDTLDAGLLTVWEQPFGIDDLTTIPGMGLFMNVGDGEYKSLDRSLCPDFGSFLLLDHIWYDQLVATDERFLIRNGCEVYVVDSAACTLLADFDTPCFRLFAVNDSVFDVVVYDDGSSSLYSGRYADGEMTLQITLPDDILRVEHTADGMLFIAGNTLYGVGKQIANSLFETEEPLLDMALTDSGALFCTASTLYLFTGTEVMRLADNAFARLFYDSGRTYIVLQSGEICYTDLFSGISE